MNDNVVHLPARKGRKRRPQCSLADSVRAQVLALPDRSNDARADFERLLDQMSVHLLAMAKIIKAHDKKHCQ